MQHPPRAQCRHLNPHPATTVETKTNSHIPNTKRNPTPGITWSSCCNLRLHSARRDTHCMCSALTSTDYSSLPSIPATPTTGATPTLRSFFIIIILLLRTHKTPIGNGPTPSRRGFWWHSQPTHKIPYAFILF